MLRNFYYRNVVVVPDKEQHCLLLKGEITNGSGKDYQSVVFRAVLFMQSTPVGHTSITINGFNNCQTRFFEKAVETPGYDYQELLKEITNSDIYAESGY